MINNNRTSLPFCLTFNKEDNTKTYSSVERHKTYTVQVTLYDSNKTSFSLSFVSERVLFSRYTPMKPFSQHPSGTLLCT